MYSKPHQLLVFGLGWNLYWTSNKPYRPFAKCIHLSICCRMLYNIQINNSKHFFSNDEFVFWRGNLISANRMCHRNTAVTSVFHTRKFSIVFLLFPLRKCQFPSKTRKLSSDSKLLNGSVYSGFWLAVSNCDDLRRAQTARWNNSTEYVCIHQSLWKNSANKPADHKHVSSGCFTLKASHVDCWLKAFNVKQPEEVESKMAVGSDR